MNKRPPISAYIAILFWITVAAAAFHAAHASVSTSPLIILYLFALLRLAQTDRWRKAFYPGLAVGLLIAVVRLAFFWPLFSGGALALWLVYAFWIGLFVALARLSLARSVQSDPGNQSAPVDDPSPALEVTLSPCKGERVRERGLASVSGATPMPVFVSRVSRLGPNWAWMLIPFLWTGLEYFRSEIYYLRFSWLNVGYAFAGAPWPGALKLLGTYRAGFLLVSLACAAAFMWQKSRIRAITMLLVGVGGFCLGGFLSGNESPTPSLARIHVAGIQMEFPTETEVLLRLKDALRAHPDTELLVLSEYTFGEPVPAAVKAWCRQNSRYLIVGGKDPVPGATFYNTAYVVGPGGDIIFRQVKAVPIQFFKDGLPAPEQKLWSSPWGKIGICICYDLSYTRVTDRLVKLGAEALIVPTMDVADWGRAQHELHARIAPVRAAEYGLPIFRVASSGISQLVDRAGRVTATAPCPGDGAVLAGTLEMRGRGSRPLDRWLAPFATGVTALTIIWFLTQRILGYPLGAGVRIPGSSKALCVPRPSQRWLLPLLLWRRGQGRGGRVSRFMERLQETTAKSGSHQFQLRKARLLSPSDP